MNKRPPQELGNSLTMLLKKMGIERKVKEYQAFTEWPEIVGEKISKVTKPERIADEVLFVKVKNSAWRNELIFMKTEILKNIDKTVGSGIIKDIKFI